MESCSTGTITNIHSGGSTLYSNNIDEDVGDNNSGAKRHDLERVSSSHVHGGSIEVPDLHELLALQPLLLLIEVTPPLGVDGICSYSPIMVCHYLPPPQLDEPNSLNNEGELRCGDCCVCKNGNVVRRRVILGLRGKSRNK